MVSRAESVTVNAAGLVQGIALVTFPAASTIFTARGSYNLSSSQYGAMFIPQVIAAIIASLLGAGLLWPGLAGRLSRLPAIFAASAVVAAAMGGLSLVAAHRQPSPASVHPRPARPWPRLSPAAGPGKAPACGLIATTGRVCAAVSAQNSARSGGPRLIRG